MQFQVNDKVRIGINDEIYQKYWGAFGVVSNVINEFIVNVRLENGDNLTIQSDRLNVVKSKPINPRNINTDKCVVPHDLWISLRRKEIQKAIISFCEAGLPIKQEWIDEWNGETK